MIIKHNKVSYLLFRTIALLIFLNSICLDAISQNLTKYVDPLIGSGGHGYVFVGASVPFGGVQLEPDNFYKGWDWFSGYNYQDSVVRGFAHTHLSGTGIGVLPDILIMPYTGSKKLDIGKETVPGIGYASLFSHDDEQVRPGYYAVKLRNKVKVELTASGRVGFYKYQFPAGEEAHVVFDLKEGFNDKSTDTFIEQVGDCTFKGYRASSSWAKSQMTYFAIKSSILIKDFTLYNNQTPLDGKSAKNTAVKGLISFASAPSQLQLKVAISPVSSDNALLNLDAEIPHWDFNCVFKEADSMWNKELFKIKVKSKNNKDLSLFYTSLYYTMINPSLFNDHNGDYRGTDKKVYKNAAFTNYSVFSLWETYRALHPLYTITQTEKVGDMFNSMLAIYDQQGSLPIWHLMSYETGTMVGISSQQVIAEAYLKGIKGFDSERAFAAMKSTAMLDIKGQKYIKEFKAIPSDSKTVSRPVAQALELAVGDASIAMMAKHKSKNEDFQYFKKRGQCYRSYYDSSVGFLRGKMSNGTWNPNFDSLKYTRPHGSDFAEGNSWQNLWLIPQDVHGLVVLQGGEKSFNAKLDTFFSIPLTGELVDLTGGIGQYAHGNEPRQHNAYTRERWKTAGKVRHIMKDMYHDIPDGIIGNEDYGQMSAWYVFSALGFYQGFPASGNYVIGSPIMDEATINLPGGKKFTLISTNNSDENIYV